MSTVITLQEPPTKYQTIITFTLNSSAEKIVVTRTCRIAFAFSKMAATLIFVTGRTTGSFFSFSVCRRLNDWKKKKESSKSLALYLMGWCSSTVWQSSVEKG